ncbi:acetylserotonin O-methyltransferase 1-like [Triticum dicoccoides]|uniref:acetylserotonin O-methyltransferase 1-like n=1 Tax=Triticum dicoccoides TaxID=85692 RepID=UPI00188FF35A|nr:acetylserotonin O-methyltransferase 1-like [Triticum dicoccoides]
MASHVQEDELTMSSDDLLQAQLELYHHCFVYVKSMALGAATDLRIADAIHLRGGAVTLSDLAADTRIHPTKLSHLRRLMRVLTTSGIFSAEVKASGDMVYKLTRVSRLLVGAGGESSRRRDLSPMVGVFVNPVAITAFFSIHEWFTDEKSAASPSLFEVAHGCTRWEMIAKDASDDRVFNAGMAADSCLSMEILLRECNGVFGSLGSSLVDVGGAHGAATAVVAKAFPHVKCTVLDLPRVLAGAPVDDNLTFVPGDMFEYIPPADTVLLKWILHDWPDEDCIKILCQCKKAIPTRDAGGKVIIMDMVVGSAGPQQETMSQEAEVLFDVFMMYIDGIQREEHEWRKIFFEAGFSDYKITPVTGIRSIIEVYP